jgi:hypothetical protein
MKENLASPLRMKPFYGDFIRPLFFLTGPYQRPYMQALGYEHNETHVASTRVQAVWVAQRSIRLDFLIPPKVCSNQPTVCTTVKYDEMMFGTTV